MPRSGVHRSLLWMFAAALGLLPLFAALPDSTALWRLLNDTAHAPVFALLAIVLLWLQPGRARRHEARAYLAAGIAAVVIGAGVELVQIPLARDAEWGDVARDALGTLAGLGSAALAGWCRGARNRWRIHLAAAGIVAVLVVVAPVAWALAAYAERASKFPTLASFGSGLDLFFVSGVASARCKRIDWRGGPALAVDLGPGRYPGVSFDEPQPDWRAYDTLVVDLGNGGADPLGVTVRVHDGVHDLGYDDRYNEHFVLAPGETRLELPLARIERAPKGRRLDLGAIAGIIIFADEGRPGRRFLVRSITLARRAVVGAGREPLHSDPGLPPRSS